MYIVGRLQFSQRLKGTLLRDLFIVLSPGHTRGAHYHTLAEAKADGANTWNVGFFLENCVDFLFTALIVFWLVRLLQRILEGLHESIRVRPTDEVKVWPFFLL